MASKKYKNEYALPPPASDSPNQVVVDTSRDVLPEWGAGVLDDPRLDLHYTDAHAFLRENEGMYDVIIMDIADPIEAGPGYILYTQASSVPPYIGILYV